MSDNEDRFTVLSNAGCRNPKDFRPVLTVEVETIWDVIEFRRNMTGTESIYRGKSRTKKGWLSSGRWMLEDFDAPDLKKWGLTLDDILRRMDERQGIGFLLTGKRPGHYVSGWLLERGTTSLDEHTSTRKFYGTPVASDKQMRDCSDVWFPCRSAEHPGSGEVVKVWLDGKPLAVKSGLTGKAAPALSIQQDGPGHLAERVPATCPGGWSQSIFKSAQRMLGWYPLCSTPHGNRSRLFHHTMVLVHELELPEEVVPSWLRQYNMRHAPWLRWEAADLEAVHQNARTADLSGHVFGWNITSRDPRWLTCIPLIRLQEALSQGAPALSIQQDGPGLPSHVRVGALEWNYHPVAVENARLRNATSTLRTTSKAIFTRTGDAERLAKSTMLPLFKRYLEGLDEVPMHELEVWFGKGAPVDANTKKWWGLHMTHLGWTYRKNRKVYVRGTGTQVQPPRASVIGLMEKPTVPPMTDETRKALVQRAIEFDRMRMHAREMLGGRVQAGLVGGPDRPAAPQHPSEDPGALRSSEVEAQRPPALQLPLEPGLVRVGAPTAEASKAQVTQEAQQDPAGRRVDPPAHPAEETLQDAPRACAVPEAGGVPGPGGPLEASLGPAPSGGEHPGLLQPSTQRAPLPDITRPHPTSQLGQAQSVTASLDAALAHLEVIQAPKPTTTVPANGRTHPFPEHWKDCEYDPEDPILLRLEALLAE